jgi:hypothetical protein
MVTVCRRSALFPRGRRGLPLYEYLIFPGAAALNERNEKAYLLETWKGHFADRGSSAWFIGDPGAHDPAMDAPCKAPAACRDSRIDNAHVVPTLHRIYMHVHET